MFKRILFLSVTLLLGCQNSSNKQDEFSKLPVWDPNFRTKFVQDYDSGKPAADELENVQCPIPMNCRVRNYTGIQCVFSSLECLARWAEIKELLEPEPLTSRSGCKSYSGPIDAAEKLNNYGVKFENIYRDKGSALILLKKAMSDGRGALMDVPGHAIVICHYDEKEKIVKIIDNSDRSLRIQTWSMEKFNRLWGGWILVIYGKKDLFPAKARVGDLINQIPIIDRNNPQGVYPPNYIPKPK